MDAIFCRENKHIIRIAVTACLLMIPLLTAPPGHLEREGKDSLNDSFDLVRVND